MGEPDRFVSRGDAAQPPQRPSEPELPGSTLERGLAIARAARGLTFIAIPAPLLSPPTLVDAWRAEALVSWSSPELTAVGIGVARTLRGSGIDRWAEVASAARALEIYGAVFAPIGDALGPKRASLLASDTRRPAELGFARPRLFGGGAFAPGAADRGPWVGFGDALFVLPRWTYTHDGTDARLVLAVDEREARDPGRWRAELAKFRALFAAPTAPQPMRTPAVEIARASTDLWRAQVEAITSAIEAGTCSKIVAARTCTVGLPSTVIDRAAHSHEAALLAALDEHHRDCVRLLVRPPAAGALIAATPERLVRRDGATVRCDALAGTVRHTESGARASSEAAAQLLSSAKDRREHELVVRAIDGALAALGAEIDAPAEPLVRTLRHVLHLHTPIRATLPNPRHVLDLVAALHPTPAVGGTPTDYAVDWIRDHEPVPRGWYASPVGWFDLEGDGEFAVAIRSGVIVGDRAHLWAGAGIVAGSDPDRELGETELKLRAMLGALGVAR